MTITVKKAITTSINLSDEDKEILRAAYHCLDRIDDIVQNNCERTITNFAEAYYGDILTFLHCLFTETDQMSKYISEYINDLS